MTVSTAHGARLQLGPFTVRIDEPLQLDAPQRAVYRVSYDDAPGMLWTGSEAWGRRVLGVLADHRHAGLPQIVASTVVDGQARILVTAPPAGSEPFDIWKWRHAGRRRVVAALEALAHVVGHIHGRGGWLQGIRRGELFLEPSTGALSLVAMPRLEAFDADDAEVVWRDIRPFGELLYENFMEHEYPGGHRLVALLQDRAAMAEIGLTRPGFTQVLAGCVTPYGDLAYANTDELRAGLGHLAAELERPLRYRVGSASTVGSYIFRQNNQDACGHVVVDAICGSRKVRTGFFCVADGIGGIQDGERASRLAVETACNAFGRAWSHYGAGRLEQAPVAFARGIARVTSQRLALQGEFDPEQNRGGTTFSGLLLAGGRAGLCHVGDSRVVLVRGDRIHTLTEDHSLATILVKLGELTAIEAAAHEASQRTISRFLSTANEIECERIDGFSAEAGAALGLSGDELASRGLALEPGDLFILTSDGAHNEIDDATLRRLILLHADDPQPLCEAIVEHALAKIGRDNATVLAVRVEV